MWHLNTESIWHDEGWSIRAFRGPFTTPDDNTPPLYYLSGHLLWRLGSGETPLALRYNSVLISTLTVALAIYIGRRWFQPVPTLMVGILVAISPLLWEYAQEVRAYVAVPLIALLLIACAEAILNVSPRKTIPRRLWLTLFGVQLAGLYTHNLAVPLIVWMNIFVGLFWVIRRQWHRILIHASWQMILIIAYLPWLSTQSPSGTPLNTPPQFDLELVRNIWLSYFLPVQAQLIDTLVYDRTLTTLIVGLGVLVMLLILLVLLTPQGRHMRLSLLISHMILVPGLTTLLMIIAGIDFHPRYYIASLPGTLFLTIYAITLTVKTFSLRLIVYSGTVLIFALISARSLHTITTTRIYQHDDFDGLATYYATLPEDHVILIPFDAERALQDYFDRTIDIPPRLVNIPLYSNEITAIQTLNTLYDEGVRHVELLTWFQLPADVRGMYPCLLAGAHDDEQLPEPKFFYGLSTQAFTLSPIELQTIELESPYQKIDMVDTVYISGEVAACVRTSWHLNSIVEEDINIATTMQTSLDIVLSQNDAKLARDDNVGTSAWKKDQIGNAYNLLWLPPGIPHDDYTLTLSAYTTPQPDVFNILDTRDKGSKGNTFIIQETLSLKSTPLHDVITPALSQDTSINGVIQPGIPLDVTLILPAGTHTVALGGIMQTTTLESAAQSWHRFILPPGNDKIVALVIDKIELARYIVVDVPHLLKQPDFDIPVDVSFAEIGRLVGATLHWQISPDMPLQITLIWQAESETNTAYTIFVQMIDEDGTVIAQSDHQPADGTRPTTGWIAGEYIIDRHTLEFNQQHENIQRRFIAGLYDENDGFRRLLTESGMDHAEIMVSTSSLAET